MRFKKYENKNTGFGFYLYLFKDVLNFDMFNTSN